MLDHCNRPRDFRYFGRMNDVADKMVIVRLGGRLGNQMFQYAAGKVLARRIGGTLAFEGYDAGSRSTKGPLVLRSFGLPEPLALFHKGWLDKQRIKIARSFGIGEMRGLELLVEHGFHYDKAFEEISGGCYMVGGWQSHRYLIGMEGELARDFSFNGVLSEAASKTLDFIRSKKNTIGIHVRRGDYVENSRILARHGSCGLDYYQRALSFISDGLEDISIVIFSDDIVRAKREMASLGEIHCVSDTTAEEDLHLMANCRHNIIANSTFSWWAAWLNRHPDKRVVAPANWFGPKLAVRHDIKDLFPGSWTVL